MTLLYFDCFNGASGDMILGALLDAGLPLDELRRALGSLGIDEYELAAERVLRAGVSATKFHLIERAGTEREAPHGAAHAHAGIEVPAPHRGRHAAAGTQGEGPHGATHAHAAPEDVARQGGHTHAHGAHPHRILPEILSLIERSALPPPGR